MQEVVSTLNTLIATCRDGEQGFRTAAEDVKDPTLKVLFNDLARERGSFADELKQEIQKLGGVPRDDQSLLSEAERGEDEAIATYKQALVSALSPSTHDLVERQYGRVKQAHDRVRSLRESYKHSHA